MTREEAICGLEDMLMSKLDGRNNLEAVGKEVPIMLVQDIEALKMAIEALEKQIPKKAEWTDDPIWGELGVKKKTPMCPICGYSVEDRHFIIGGQKVTYCDHCGQAIDWSVLND